MQSAAFVARVDVELDDIVEYEGQSWRIHEIRCEHYMRSGGVVFKFLLIDRNGFMSDWLQRDNFIYPLKNCGK